MGKQTVRQSARRAALELQTRRRREQSARRQQLETHALDLVVALRERDDAEHRAGDAIRAMLAHGLNAGEVMAWCEGELTLRDLRRLQQLSADQPGAPARINGDVAAASASSVEVGS